MVKLMADTQNAQLPNWPFDAFTTDARLDRVVRVAIVEHSLAQAYGEHHVPDKQGNERYFAIAIDALMQRRWLARYIVDSQDWRENFARIASQPHGAVLPSMREVAAAQRAEYEATGEVRTTGFERMNLIARGA
jgi:hypothetical protein